MSIRGTVLLVLTTLAMPALAQEAPQSCQSEQGRISEIEAKYKPQYGSLEQKGKDLEKDAPSNNVQMDFKVEMKEQKWRFNLPSITLKRNDIVLGLPQTTMKNQRWTYDVPTVRMERRKVGQHPETTCSKDNWGIPYDCRTVWKDNFIDVPVTVMQRNEVKVDVPEFKWTDTKLSWDIPQLTWVENNWVVKIPEFTLVNVNVEKGKKLKDRSDNLSKEAAEITAARNLDTRAATTSLFGCFRSEIAKQRSVVERQMDDGISSLQSTIQSIRAQGADPTKVPSTGNQAINLEASLADLIKKRAEAVESFWKAAQDLDESEKKAFVQLSA